MELFAADGHDAGGCERVTGKSGMRPLEVYDRKVLEIVRNDGVPTTDDDAGCPVVALSDRTAMDPPARSCTVGAYFG